MHEDLAKRDRIKGSVKGRVTDGAPHGSMVELILVVITDVPQ